MSTLKIQFGEYTADAGQAAVPMEVINKDMERVWAKPAELGQVTSVDVEPGNYLIRAQLPSGDVATAQAQVGAGATEDVYLAPATLSPRESLSWAYYLKGSARNTKSAVRQEAYSVNEALPNIQFWLHRTYADWELFPYNPQQNTNLFAHIENSYFDPSVRQDDANALASIGINTNSQWRWNLGQFWLQVSGLNYPSKFVALPPSDHMRILLVLDDTPGQDQDPLNVVVDGGNPQAEALLGFLNNRDFASARVIGEDVIKSAEALLYDKQQDPASAAIGGYYLLTAGKLDRLHDWTNNLANWIPWMPDGAVIHAWHLLRQTRPDEFQARARLIEAASRGVPLYTKGLRLLFDGLNIMKRRTDGTDEELNLALERISPYAVAADWTTPTTTFFGQTPSDPNPLQQTA